MARHEGIPGPDEHRIPIAEALPGLEIHALEPGSTPIEAFVLVKLLDEHGHPGWSYRMTSALNREELLGALMVQTDVLRKELRDEWDDED